MPCASARASASTPPPTPRACASVEFETVIFDFRRPNAASSSLRMRVVSAVGGDLAGVQEVRLQIGGHRVELCCFEKDERADARRHRLAC